MFEWQFEGGVWRLLQDGQAVGSRIEGRFLEDGWSVYCVFRSESGRGDDFGCLVQAKKALIRSVKRRKSTKMPATAGGLF